MDNPLVKRSDTLDNIKGILIILVVFAHCLYDFQSSALINLITDTIYMFHMPVFIFFTGYLSKSKHSRSGEALTKLFGAYLLFNTLMMLYHYTVNGQSFSLLSPYNSYWYLLAVIVWRAVSEHASRVRGALVFSALLAMAAGFYGELTNMLAIARIVSFYPFFLAGFLLSSEWLGAFLEKRKKLDYVKGLLLTAVAVGLSAMVVVQYTVSDTALQMHEYQDLMEVMVRLCVFILSALIILGLLMCVPERRIPVLTRLGRNSLSIFLLHRVPTLLLVYFLSGASDAVVLTVSAAVTAALVLALGSEPVSKALGEILNFISDLLRGKSKSSHAPLARVCAVIISVTVFGLRPLMMVSSALMTLSEDETIGSVTPDRIYPQLTAAQQAEFADDATILFTGDLILLEDQVRRAYRDGGYDFSELFEYTAKYISRADLAIGVFEGPMAGEEAGYSSSNYDDGKELYLNFPDEFASAVKAAGFDLVTTANNHLLDKGLDGAMRTLDVLDETGLDHIGSYRSAEEKENQRVRLVEIDGVRIAVLAYTYGSNYHSTREFIDGGYSFLTSVTADPSDPYFEAAKELVRADFEKAKAESPDLIAVLPHMGEQFLNAPDDYQQAWNELFLSYGADIVLNDHTHSVQPVEIRQNGGRTQLIVNCPGNYVNIYREFNGDAAAMVEVYIDKNSKTITGAAVIPMWIESQISGNYRALPIYDIMNDEALRGELTTDDLERVGLVHKLVTRVMLGTALDCDTAEERCFMTADGYAATPPKQAELSEQAVNTELYRSLVSAESVCFVGDSITEGTRNGGFGWYTPLAPLCGTVYEAAKGGGTTGTILPTVGAEAELYVVALGTNDVRYRNEAKCAMTAEEYIARLEDFTQRIRLINPEAEFAFVAPWMALAHDTVSVLPPASRDAMLEEYSAALEEWCGRNGFLYSNPNAAIKKTLTRLPESDYMVDFIHPNRTDGIELYCTAVLENSR